MTFKIIIYTFTEDIQRYSVHAFVILSNFDHLITPKDEQQQTLVQLYITFVIFTVNGWAQALLIVFREVVEDLIRGQKALTCVLFIF